MSNMFPMAGGYDRAITVFNPEGRLLQVEYALTATKQSAICFGIKCVDGVILGARKGITSSLMEEAEKVFKIDEHIGAVFAGLRSDGRVLIARGRLEAQINKLTYGEPITVEALANRIAEYEQVHTQYAGSRPFGVLMIIGGVDTKPRLMMTHLSGFYLPYKAYAVGMGSQTARQVFEEEYRDDMTIDDGMKLGIKAVQKAAEKKVPPDDLEIAVIRIEDRKFTRLTLEEIEKYFKAAGY